MSQPLLVVAVAFGSLAVARQALLLMETKTRVNATAAPLGSLDYDHPTDAAIVAARFPEPDVENVKRIADELGGLIVELRPVADAEEAGRQRDSG